MSRISETPKGVLETYDWQDVAEDLQEKLDKYKEEINKLTAESTEWEERTYCWQDRAENLQIVLDKIKEYVLEVSQETLNNGRVFYNGTPAQTILELLEEIE